MATFHSFAALPQRQASPPAIGSMHSNAHPGSRKDPCIPSASVEISRLTAEYEAEADRLAEQLDLCGIQKESLSSKARLSVQLLASIANTLHLAGAQPELVLAAWAALVVKESRALGYKHKLQQGADALAQQRQAAQAKLKALQQVAHEVQVQQKKYAALVHDEVKNTGQMREKDQEYHKQIAKSQKKLNRNGFTPELTHAALIAKQGQVAELQQRLEDMQARLQGYHHLPASKLGAQMMLQQAQERLKEKQEKLQSRLADMH